MAKVTRAKSPLGRLTESQYDILLYVLSTPILREDEGPTKWSPTLFMGFVPSKSQSVILSKRLASLIDRGLVSRNGDEVRLTALGYRALRTYVSVAEDDTRGAYTSCLLKLEEVSKQANRINETRDWLGARVLSRDYTFDLTPEAMDTTKAVLESVRAKLDAEADDLLESIRESAERMQRDREGFKK